jgi:hypothetical protein
MPEAPPGRPSHPEALLGNLDIVSATPFNWSSKILARKKEREHYVILVLNNVQTFYFGMDDRVGSMIHTTRFSRRGLEKEANSRQRVPKEVGKQTRTSTPGQAAP